jgi:lysophospholipid acyltransferase
MTQVIFAFVTAPFLILSLSDSLVVWSRVYFYGILATALSMAFFVSPGKQRLRSMVEERHRRRGAKLTRTASHESLTSREPLLGVSADPERDISEVMTELRAEMTARRRKGAAET